MKLILLSFFALLATVHAQYPDIDHEEELFQSPEPISIFARSGSSRIPRGGGYGSAPIEILPVPGPSYGNQQIESLPNYGGGEIAPIKQDPYSGGNGALIGGGGGYGPGPSIPIKKEPYIAPNYGGGGSGYPVKPIGGDGYGSSVVSASASSSSGGGGGYGAAPLKPIDKPGPGYGGGGGAAPFKEDFGGGGYGKPVKQEQYIAPVPAYGGGGGGGQKPYGHRQPHNHGYGSGSGISFGNPGGQYAPQHGGYKQEKPQPAYGGGGGWSSASASASGGGGYDSYSKPPIVQPGYGTPLAPPPQKAPGGYGR